MPERMTPLRKPQWIALVAAAGLAAFVGACSDPAFHKANERRMQNIRDVVDTYRDQERDNAKRLDEWGDRMGTFAEYREKRLDRSLQEWHELFQRHIDEWPARRKAARQHVREMLKGKPDEIADTARRMWY